MTEIPEGAQRSEDGNYWWDGQQWQLVEQPLDEAEGDPQRAAARAEAGLPRSLFDVSDEQRAHYLSEAQVTIEAEAHDEVEVLAMQDAGSGNGEAWA